MSNLSERNFALQMEVRESVDNLIISIRENENPFEQNEAIDYAIMMLQDIKKENTKLLEHEAAGR